MDKRSLMIGQNLLPWGLLDWKVMEKRTNDTTQLPVEEIKHRNRGGGTINYCHFGPVK